jgi:voltage-dependent calcium channel T type alpha-1I
MEIRARDNRFYMFFYRIINSSAFKIISLLAIFSNIIILGLVKDNSSQTYDNVLEGMNLAFFSFFVFELVAKVVGQGIKQYVKDRFNWFDSGVVLISAIDVTL